MADRDGGEIPDLTDAQVASSPTGLSVKVLHAQDVDLSDYEPDDVVPPARVRVEVHVEERQSTEVTFEGRIDVPSGVLTIGDAEDEAELEIGSGSWSVQVACDADEHAESVAVWFQPA